MSRTTASKSKASPAIAGSRSTPAIADERPRPKNPALVDSPTPTPSAITMLPLRALGRAPENVRHIRPDEDVAGLADDIAANGLLQSVIGYNAPGAGGVTTWIVGGGRRLQALNLLVDRFAITPDFPVSVLIRDRDEAIELSLSENLSKRDMSPVDECRAFRALMDRGNTSPHELAKRFGFGERYVRQRLRLADLAPEILDALAERKITLPAAEAYARSSDAHLQVDVFKAQEKTSWEAHQPHRIRAALNDLQSTTGSPLYRFVGAESYERAGGGYEDDLFTGDEKAGEHRKLSHGHLLVTKADEMVRFQSIRLEPELREELPGFAGIAVPPNVRSGGFPWKAPTAPKGQALVESDWQVDRKAIWVNARRHEAPVTVIVGVDASGKIEVVRDKLFVDKEFVERVKPKPKGSGSGYVPETAEQRAARLRELGVDELQWRLAVPGFAGTPYEGRAYWPERYVSPVQPSGDPRHAGGRLVAVQIFVSDAEHDAMRAAAERRYDEELAAAAEEERRDARERARREAIVTELIAMEPPPAVIAADGGVYYRKPAGDWTDAPAEIDDPDLLGLFTGIAALLDDADLDLPVSFWPSIEAYRAFVKAGETADA